MLKLFKKLHSYFFDVDLGTSINYNPALDGIRGISILLVLFFHYFPGRFPYGYIGVDLFFLISAFLITSIIKSQLDRNKFSFILFYRNRIRRLFPAMSLLLFTALLVGYILVPPYFYKSLGNHIFSSAFYWQNFRLMYEIGYWDVNAHFKPLLHIWSLSVEEQFYLSWPLLIFVLYRLRILNYKTLYLIALVMWITSIILSHYMPTKSFYNIVSRWWEFSLGGALALFVWFNTNRKLNITEKKELVVTTLTLLTLVIYSVLFLKVRMFYPTR